MNITTRRCALDYQVCCLVREARLNRGVSQRKIAEYLGVTPQQVSKYESGTDHLSAGTLLCVCMCLGVSVTELLYGQRGERPAETPAG
jgi:transcriptional regulator with XRE-family HTH domain